MGSLGQSLVAVGLSFPSSGPLQYVRYSLHAHFTAKIVLTARRYGRNLSLLTRVGGPYSSDSGIQGPCLWIFRTPLSWGDLMSKDRWSPWPAHIIRQIVGFEVGNARVSDGRRRPGAARHDGHEKDDTILWLRFHRSGPVIIAAGAGRAGRGVGSMLRALSIVARRAFNSQRLLKKSIYSNARRTALLL